VPAQVPHRRPGSLLGLRREAVERGLDVGPALALDTEQADVVPVDASAPVSASTFAVFGSTTWPAANDAAGSRRSASVVTRVMGVNGVGGKA
jgi:hypothetical protein